MAVAPVMFADRVAAGLQLGIALRSMDLDDAVVLGLPRGGVPVAAAAARILDLPLDVIVVRKIGAPGQPELAVGAVGEDGAVVLNDDVVSWSRISDEELERAALRERAVLDERLRRIRAVRPREELRGRTAILVDDGIATGATMRAAVEVARQHGAQRVVVAAPVAPPDVVAVFAGLADAVCVLEQPENFVAVGSWYNRFDQVSDEEVLRLLSRARSGAAREAIMIDCDGDLLAADLCVPADALGVVVFVHGSGSSRHSPRNCWVAGFLARGGIATLLMDLETAAERGHGDGSADGGDDLDTAIARVGAAVSWLASDPRTQRLPVGLCGASTGAAVAVGTAAAHPERIAAVVSRGGRIDLARGFLTRLEAPTLCIVGALDDAVLDLNQQAMDGMHCSKRLSVIDGATHLFPEPGTLEQAAVATSAWFETEFARHHSKARD